MNGVLHLSSHAFLYLLPFSSFLRTLRSVDMAIFLHSSPFFVSVVYVYMFTVDYAV